MLRQELGLRLSPQLKIEVRPELRTPHSPITNPDLTARAYGKSGNIEEVLEDGRLDQYGKMLATEAVLLGAWQYSDKWTDYLDTPLIVHADAALSLQGLYDGVVGIREAGLPYADIFRIMGFETFEIDHSHWKRKMSQPVIEKEELEKLREKRAVLLVDIDFVTGRTIREVAGYLDSNRVNVGGAYIGLNRWPGLKVEGPSISEDTVNFGGFWMSSTGGLVCIRSKKPYKLGIVPEEIRLFSANPKAEKYFVYGSAVARRVARQLKKLYQD